MNTFLKFFETNILHSQFSRQKTNFNQRAKTEIDSSLLYSSKCSAS